MRNLSKIIIISLFIFIVIFMGAFLFLNIKGKSIIIAQLKDKLRPNVDMDSIRLIFPLTLKIHQFSIENFLQVEDMFIQPSLLSLVSGNIGFSQIVLINPQIIIEKAPDGSYNVASLLKSKPGKSKPVVIGSLTIKNGIIDFIDKKISPDGFKVKITDLDMKVQNPLSPRFKIDASVRSEGQAVLGAIRANGWINLLRKDMKAEFKLSDLDGAFFSPYFQTFLSGQKLKSAIVNSQINLAAKNNDIDGKCHLEVDNIVYEKQEDSARDEKKESSLPNPLSFVLGMDAIQPKHVTLDLPIKGTLIPFRINLVKITGSIFTEILKEIITQEPEKLPEKIEAIGDKFKVFGKEIEKIFKEKYKKETE